MKLEITPEQAEILRAQQGKVIEETRYYAVVKEVAADPVVLTPKKQKKREVKSYMHTSTPVRRTRTRLSLKGHIARQVWMAVTEVLPDCATPLPRRDLIQEVHALVPEYSPQQITSCISRFAKHGLLKEAA